MATETKELGKINEVRFGLGGYDGCMIGISLDFRFGESQSSGVSWWMGPWDPCTMKRSDSAKWTESDRDRELVDLMRKISSLLSEAKVDQVHKLKGKPVEITMDGMILKSWRILTEVI